jgi:anti-sigma factor RsiW
METIMTRHVTLDHLLDYQAGRLNESERQAVQKHLSDCETCLQNTELVSAFQRRGPSAPPAQSEEHSEDLPPKKKNGHLEPDQIEKFFSGSLSSPQQSEVEKHLAVCDVCRGHLAEIFHVCLEPVSDEEMELLKSLPALEIEEEVRQILKLAEERHPLSWHEKFAEWLGTLGEGCRKSWERLVYDLSPRYSLGTALAGVMLLVAIGYSPFRAWRAGVHVRAAMDILRGEQTITSDDLRPSANFPLSIFSSTHSPAGTDSVGAELHEALAWDAKNRAAQRGLAIHLYFKGDLTRADSLLRVLLRQDSLDVESWNDLGLVRARAEDTTGALVAFGKALRRKPDYAEAAFNRAALLQASGRTREARQAWQDYLQIDDQSKWAEVVRRRLTRLP